MVIGGILQNAKSFKQPLAYLSYPLRAPQLAFRDPVMIASMTVWSDTNRQDESHQTGQP
jgi:hypothetical protein